MRLPIFSAALAALCLALPTTAQEGKPAADAKGADVKGATATSQRAEARIMVFNEDFTVFALASITHGQPVWQDKYDGMLDMLKGKINRLGKDWFTTLITSAELELGGVKVAPGSYVVGLACDKDGKFALALLDSSKAMQDKVNPFFGEWKPDYLLPLTLNKNVGKETVSLMVMTFDAKADDGGKGTFTLAWGKHTLTAPVMLHAPK